MPDVDDRDRARRTEFLATRLMKCRARHGAYAERALATGNPALSYVALLEAELLREAERDWRVILQHWLLRVPSDHQRLLALLQLARDKAQREVCAVFDDQITTESLTTFFGVLKPESLIERGPS